jgi:hypothetical protein
MSEWCQNKKCPDKKNQNQIRGIRGAKYYQSNKANRYMGYWCSTGCRDQWFDNNKETCMQAVGIIPKQTLPLEDAWFFDSDYHWQLQNDDDTDDSRYVYFLVNRLMGVKHSITREQAQTPEQLLQSATWAHKQDSEAKPLAIKLGLVS